MTDYGLVDAIKAAIDEASDNRRKATHKMTDYKDDLNEIKKLAKAIGDRLDNADVQSGGSNATIAVDAAGRQIRQARERLGYVIHNLEQYVPMREKKPIKRRERATVGPSETK